MPTPTHALTILNKDKTKENKGQNVTPSHPKMLCFFINMHTMGVTFRQNLGSSTPVLEKYLVCRLLY